MKVLMTALKVFGCNSALHFKHNVPGKDNQKDNQMVAQTSFEQRLYFYDTEVCFEGIYC